MLSARHRGAAPAKRLRSAVPGMYAPQICRCRGHVPDGIRPIRPARYLNSVHHGHLFLLQGIILAICGKHIGYISVLSAIEWRRHLTPA